MMNMEENVVAEPDASLLNEADKWILSRVNRLSKDVTENMDKFELGIAVQKVYDFIWDEFCDWYVETAKYRIYHKRKKKRLQTAIWVLKTVLKQALKLLHPFMPFIRGDLQRTGPGRRISDDVRVATVSCRVGFPGRRKCDGTCKRDHTRYPQYARRDECSEQP